MVYHCLAPLRASARFLINRLISTTYMQCTPKQTKLVNNHLPRRHLGKVDFTYVDTIKLRINCGCIEALKSSCATSSTRLIGLAGDDFVTLREVSSQIDFNGYIEFDLLWSSYLCNWCTQEFSGSSLP